jgi:hypothetical protein
VGYAFPWPSRFYYDADGMVLRHEQAWIAAGVLALFGAGIVIAATQIGKPVFSNDGDSDYLDLLLFSFASATIWTVTGINVLVFACGKRYEGNEDQLKAEGAATNQVSGAAPVAGTSTTTITNRLDGSVFNKNGKLHFKEERRALLFLR